MTKHSTAQERNELSNYPTPFRKPDTHSHALTYPIGEFTTKEMSLGTELCHLGEEVRWAK